MRPDEHKKKKNAAYKKKHGIGQAKGQGEVSSCKNKKGKQNEEYAHDGHRKNAVENKSASSAKVKQEVVGTSGSSESETEEVAQPKKTFQRRQIVSNWGKYELQLDDDEAKAEVRGESFEKLLSMSGDAIAHFRFKDEQEWDIVGGFVNSKLDDDQCGQYLNVDTQQIGEAMACLPLHKALRLNPEIFPSDEIASMNAAACGNREAFLQAHPTVSAALPSSSDTPSTRQYSLHQEDSQKPSVNNLLKDEHSDSTCRTLSSNATQTNIEGSITDTHRATGTADAVQAPLTLNDEDLDVLLDLDTPGESPKSGGKPPDYVQQRSELGPSSHLPDAATKSEDTTSALRSTDANLMKQKAVLLKSQHEKECPKKDSADLEDWLDSILDD